MNTDLDKEFYVTTIFSKEISSKLEFLLSSSTNYGFNIVLYLSDCLLFQSNYAYLSFPDALNSNMTDVLDNTVV